MPASWHNKSKDTDEEGWRGGKDHSASRRSDEGVHERAALERADSFGVRAVGRARKEHRGVAKAAATGGAEEESEDPLQHVRQWIELNGRWTEELRSLDSICSSSANVRSLDSAGAKKEPFGSGDIEAWQEIDALRRHRGSCISAMGSTEVDSARDDWFVPISDVERGKDMEKAAGTASPMRSYCCSVRAFDCVGKILSVEEPLSGRMHMEAILGTLAHLQHPKLAFLVGATTMPDGCVHVFTEYCEGGSLLDVLVSRNSEKASISQLLLSSILRPKLSREVSWIGDLLEALCYLHSDGINCVHGNISLSNILLSKDGEYAKLTDTIINKNLPLNRALTREKDIRSVGFVVWQLATGKVIIWDSVPEDKRDTSGGFVFATEDDIQASAISKKGMRALYKACVHQQGSSHVPARTAEELLQVKNKLQRMKALTPSSRGSTGGGGVWDEEMMGKSFHSGTGSALSSPFAAVIAEDMHRAS